MVFKRTTITPPPSTVSMVRQSKLGVTASKSYSIDPRTIHSTYLKDTHAISLTQNIFTIFIVAPTNLSGGNEQIEGIVLLGVIQASGHLLLDLTHSLLLVTMLIRIRAKWIRREAEILLVTPQNRWTSTNSTFGQNVVEIGNLKKEKNKNWIVHH